MDPRGWNVEEMVGESYRLLNAEEVAVILNVSKTHVYNMMKKGIIPTVYIANSRRVRPEDLEWFIRSNLNIAEEYESFFETYHEI